MTRRKILLVLIFSLTTIAFFNPFGFWTGKCLAVDAFNRRVAAVHHFGERQWTESATGVAMEFVGDRESLEQHSPKVESKLIWLSFAVVTIVVEGYQDDSVAGSIYRLRMKKADGYWQIQSAQRQWKCQEGRGHTWWSCGPCS